MFPELLQTKICTFIHVRRRHTYLHPTFQKKNIGYINEKHCHIYVIHKYKQTKAAQWK